MLFAKNFCSGIGAGGVGVRLGVGIGAGGVEVRVGVVLGPTLLNTDVKLLNFSVKTKGR